MGKGKRKGKGKRLAFNMGGPAMDLYGNPLGAVRVLFEKSCGNAVSAVELTQSDWGIQDVFQSHLFGQNGHTQVGLPGQRA